MSVHNRGRYSRAVASRAKRARKEKGWSTAQLELRTGLATGQISRMETGERGKSISVDVLVSLSEALGLSLDELVYGDDAD